MEPSFQVAICECPDINANTMAVDVTGRYAIVSGRKCMGLIDLAGTDLSVVNTEQAQHDLTVPDSAQQYKLPADAPDQSPPAKLTPICKKMVRSSKYDPTASHFNRHLADLYALASYQMVEIHSISDLNPNKPKLLLRGHSRAIADIEWAQFDPHLIGSSAADCLTNLWDIRDSRRPSATLTSVSGATQVRFSKTSSNLVATSHEIDVRIWDIRQPNLPLHYIGAHLKKINGMDWSTNLDQLVTCGQDNTIKLWDLNVSKVKPSANLQTRIPAWRVRYTPVSTYAILTSTLPQLRSRTECMALKLWSLKSNRFEEKKLELILGLLGHSDVIIDFDWRNNAQSSTSGSCEIVSWSKDQTLRVWRIDNQLIEMNVDNSDFEQECYDGSNVVGEESLVDSNLDKNDATKSSTSFETKAETSKTNAEHHQTMKPLIDSPSRSSTVPKTQPDNQGKSNDDDDSDLDELASENLPTTNELKQEFNLINKSIPNLEFEELNYLRRVCLVTARSKNVSCRLRIALPPAYPHNECPTFTIIDSNQYGTESVCKEAKEKLLNLLNETAKAQLSRSRNCLEPCLRKFIAALQKITNHSSYRRRVVGLSGSDYKDDPITLSAQRDHSVPFPPTSGARFSGNLLICFGRPMIPTVNTSVGDSASWSVETPRSLAQLSAQLDNMRRQGTYNLSNISISYFYYGAMRRAELQSRTSGKSLSASSGGRSSSGLGGSVGSKYLSGSRNKSAFGSQSMWSKSYKCGPVIVYDASKLLGGISKELAESYVFDKDVIKMCRRNAEVAAAHNRRDLVQIWSLAELSSEGVLRSYIPSHKDDKVASSFINHDSDFGDRPWTMHPFGSKLIQSLIDHYVYNCRDVQTAAMLVWTFSSPKLGRPKQDCTKDKSGSLSMNSKKSMYDTVSSNCSNQPSANPSNKQFGNGQQADAISDEWNFVNGPETHLYSNSWSNSTNNCELQLLESSSNDQNATTMATFKTSTAITSNYDERATTNSARGDDHDRIDDSSRFPKLNILSPERSLQNDLIMHVYAELLYRLNLLNQRAMVVKNIGANSAYSEIFGDKQTLNDIPERRLPDLTIQCNNLNCRTRCRSVQCQACKRYSFYCSICRLPVKGSCSICIKCLHGGHVNHFNVWFNNNDFCPTGCGCKCLVSDD
jgi:WD40 repeat protein